MKNSDTFSLKKRALSFKYALIGIKNLIVNEHNARIHLTALTIVVLAGFAFDLNSNEWIAIIIVSGLVFLTELINSSIEELANFITIERNDKIGLIKDYAAGAVLVAAIVALIVGALIFIPKIIELTTK